MIGALIVKMKTRLAFKALNRHDLKRFMADWSSDGVMIYPGDTPQSGIFKGKPAVEEWFRSYFEQFPRIDFSVHSICVRNLFDCIGSNVAATHWTNHVTNKEGRTGEYSGVSIITIRGAKVVSSQDFIYDLGDDFRRIWSVPV